MQTTPDLLTGKFASSHCEYIHALLLFRGGLGNVLLFTNTVEELVETVGHDEVHADDVVDGAEATGRDVTLQIDISLLRRQLPGWWLVSSRDGVKSDEPDVTHLVLHGQIAPLWGHVLRHGDD